MGRLTVLVQKALDSLSVAPNDDERLGNLAPARHVQGAEVLELVAGRPQPPAVKGVAVDDGDVAKAQLLDVIDGYDAIAPEAALAVDLEGEDEAQVGQPLTQDHEAVALGAVAVVTAVKLFPVDAEGGHHLDEVAHGRRGVGSGDGGGHRVPALALALQGHRQGVALAERRRRVRQAVLVGARRPEALVLLAMPLARLGFHALDGAEQDGPRGALVVGRVDALLGGPGLELAARVHVGRGARVLEALLGAVEEVDAGVRDGGPRRWSAARRR